MQSLKTETVCSSVRKLDTFLARVAGAIRKEQELSKKLKLCWNSRKFKELASSIEEGYVHTEKVDFPHLLVLHSLVRMLDDPPSVTETSKLALLRSLWYQSILHPTP